MEDELDVDFLREFGYCDEYWERSFHHFAYRSLELVDGDYRYLTWANRMKEQKWTMEIPSTWQPSARLRDTSLS